jgi:hypothetical protein
MEFINYYIANILIIEYKVFANSSFKIDNNSHQYYILNKQMIKDISLYKISIFKILIKLSYEIKKIIFLLFYFLSIIQLIIKTFEIRIIEVLDRK